MQYNQTGLETGCIDINCNNEGSEIDSKSLCRASPAKRQQQINQSIIDNDHDIARSNIWIEELG